MLEFILTALLPISIATNLTVEALKKLCGEKLPSNVLAAAAAVVFAAAAAVWYAYSNGYSVTCVAGGFVLAWLSFLCATLGYDKVVQALKQMGVNDDK